MKKTMSALTAFIMTVSSFAAAFSTNAESENVIDDFESYSNNSELLTAYNVDNNGDKLQLSLAEDNVNGGTALKYDYIIGNNGYAGAKKVMNPQNWSNYDGISFLINSDGSGNLTTIKFVDANGVQWKCTKSISESKGWKEVEIAFSDFSADSINGDIPAAPDLTSVTDFSVYAISASSDITTTDVNDISSTTTTTIPVVVNHDGTMHVSGNKLYDGDGNEFVMKGVNLPHDWYTDYTQTSINAVADLGANTVRIVLGEGSKYTKTSKKELIDIIKWSKSRGLVCVLELHDFTGSDDPSDITDKAVGYWKEMADIINANNDYVIVNIANEWQGTWNKDDLWAETYCTAVKALRNAGLETAIMIDASGYGQETTSMEHDCKKVLASDPDKNIIFSYHMYSVLGHTKDTIKDAIDGITDQGVCLAIGEFGYWQNYMDVDERSLVDYCDEKDVGWLAWSWKGNGGYDIPLDMSKDWSGEELTDWGAWVFGGDKGIQETAKMAYTLKGYSGERNVTYNKDYVPDPEVTKQEHIFIDSDVLVDNGVLSDYDWKWCINADADDICTVTTSEMLNNGGIRGNVDLSGENYPTLAAVNSNGYDLSGHKTLDLVVRNNNAASAQIDLILKVGSDWTWVEPNTPEHYIEVAGDTTQQISFDISSVGNVLDDIKMIAFRIQPGSGDVNNPIDICSMGFDLAYDKYADEIVEMNRPKSANAFTWSYPESSFSGTTGTSISNEGEITIEYKNITDEISAGIQTETCPGLGKGLDLSKYTGAKATFTNESDKDIHVTLVMKNGSDWLWAENGGSTVINGNGGEMIVPAGETVTVYYSFTQPSWKTMASDWNYTDNLSYLNDVRAIAFKVYTSSGDTASGSLKIKDFEVLGSDEVQHVVATTCVTAKTTTSVATTTTTVSTSGGSKNGMYIKGNSLYTADGNEFIMRGMNIAHTWFKDHTIAAIDKSAEYGSNATRIVLADGTYAANGWQGTFDDPSTVEKLIKECKKNGQVAIVEYHNGTGGDDTKYVDQAVSYWLDMVDMLNKYSDCCIVNILNEWQGTWNLSTYAPTYQNAVKTLRNAGLKNVIMIDAPGWGQDAATMYNNAASILKADKDRNTMFSIHMYAVAGESSSKVKENIDKTLAQGVCLVIGEFGCNHMMSGKMYDVAYQTIMDYSQEKGVGWLAWSWCGNGSDDYFLDLVTDQSGTQLTSWGNSIVNGKNGIKETSIKLSFSQQSKKAPLLSSGTWYFDDFKLYKNAERKNIKGDANCDGEISMADAVLIMQTLANPDKYKMTEQGRNNADIYGNGDGITNMDALHIQKILLKLA